MDEKQMRERSAAKVKQVVDLMHSLQLRQEARERLNPQTGFIEKLVFWIDDEKYEAAPPVETVPVATPPAGDEVHVEIQQEAPTGEAAA